MLGIIIWSLTLNKSKTGQPGPQNKVDLLNLFCNNDTDSGAKSWTTVILKINLAY